MHSKYLWSLLEAHTSVDVVHTIDVVIDDLVEHRVGGGRLSHVHPVTAATHTSDTLSQSTVQSVEMRQHTLEQ